MFDPDPTLGRAGLLDGFACVHGLSRVVAGVDYLTGPRRVESPFLMAFEVVATMPVDLKRIKREVVGRGLEVRDVKT